jgi:alkylhydroperoxidase family enzyme
MSRLSVLGNEQLAPEMRKQAEAADQAGAGSTLLRVLGHRPEMFEAYFRFYYPMHNGGVVPPELKEMVRLRIAELNQCLT